MKNSQQGSTSSVWIIVILVLLAGGGIYMYQKGQVKMPEVNIITKNPTVPVDMTDEQKVLKGVIEHVIQEIKALL